MQDNDIIRMTRQIADFFAPYDDDEAVEGILGHITSFWEPRMRNDLLALFKSAPEKLDPRVQAAVRKLDEAA